MAKHKQVLGLLHATRGWVQALPSGLKDRLWDLWNDWADLSGIAYGCSFYQRLKGTEQERRAAYAAWRSDNWRRYPHLITEPVNEICDDDYRLAAEWMAVTSNLPLLLCEIYCCYWQDEDLVRGQFPAARPREVGALSLKRRMVAPGGLHALLRWLRRERLLGSVPPAWLSFLPAARLPRAGAWRSSTTWQAEYFEVEVTVGGFESATAASRFGKDVASLVLMHGQLVLTSPCFCPLKVADANVQVRERRADARRKSVIDESDFEDRAIPIRDFALHADLASGFECLAYGVREVARVEAMADQG